VSELIPLSAVLEAAKGKVPILPFLVIYDGERYTARALSGRSVDLQAARDGYRLTLRQESVRVNPTDIHWETNGATEVTEPQEQEEKNDEMPRPHKSQGKQTNRISLAEASELKAKGLKRCWKCKRDMPIADLNSGGMCRDGKACAAARGAVAIANPVEVVVGEAGPETIVKLPIKRSIKAKAGRRGKKRKYTRHQVADVTTTPIKSVAKSHENGVAFSDLLGVVKRLKSEHALALTTIEKLSIEKAAMHRQLQEILG
jgi:hypothetical protein